MVKCGNFKNMLEGKIVSKMFSALESLTFFHVMLTRVARFFLTQYTKTGENIPNCP
jgi:hypothetical protein